MVALSAMSYFDRTILSIAGPSIMREQGISETAMGSVYSAFLLSYAILMGPGGALADRFGPRIILSLTGFGGAILTGFTALCGRLYSFLAVRFIFGAIASPLYPSCTRMTANWISPDSTAKVQAWIVSGAAIGGAISPVLFSAMMLRFGWRTSFWLAGLFTAVVYAIWHWAVQDYPPGSERAVRDHAHKRRSDWRRLLTDRNLILLALSYFCLCYFEYIFYYWMYYYFGEIRHMGKNESATYVSITMLAMVVMTPLGGWASDRLTLKFGRRLGRRIVPVVTMTLSAVLLFLGASDFGTAATVTLLALAIGFCSSAEGPFWAAAIDTGGNHVGAAAGIMNSTGNFGGILAPVLTPWIASQLGWASGLYFGSLVVAVGVLAWFFIDTTHSIPDSQ